MPDRISRYRVARLSLHLPHEAGALAHYVLVGNTIKNGIPNAQILVDGHLRGVPVWPTTQELLECFDSALRQHLLHRD